MPETSSPTRRVLREALALAKLPPGVEVFPKQDDARATTKGVGSWLRLPYFGAAETGRRVALDGAGQPLVLAQWLGTVRRNSGAGLLAIAELLGVTTTPVALVSDAETSMGHRPWHAAQSLSSKMARLLRCGDVNRKYATTGGRSSVVQAITLAARNANWAFEDLLSALLDPGNLGGGKVQEIRQHRGEAAARVYVELGWKRAAQAPPPICSTTDIARSLAAIRTAVDATEWRGLARGTDHTILVALCSLAERLGKLRFELSVRQLARLGATSPRTAGRALRRLEQGCWLRRRDPVNAARATLVCLRVRSGRTTRPIPTRLDCSRGRNVASATHPQEGGVRGNAPVGCGAEPRPVGDLWRVGFTWGSGNQQWRTLGLGKTAYLQWQHVQAGPGLSARALADVRGVGVRAIQRQLERLAAVGLTVRDGDGRWWLGTATPDEVAEKLGLAGAHDVQQARHADERAAYRERLQRREIRARCASDGQVVSLELACEFDQTLAAAARALPGSRWHRGQRLWVVPLTTAAANAVVPFARLHGFSIAADAQAAIDITWDIKAPGRRDEGRRAR